MIVYTKLMPYVLLSHKGTRIHDFTIYELLVFRWIRQQFSEHMHIYVDLQNDLLYEPIQHFSTDDIICYLFCILHFASQSLLEISDVRMVLSPHWNVHFVRCRACIYSYSSKVVFFSCFLICFFNCYIAMKWVSSKCTDSIKSSD